MDPSREGSDLEPASDLHQGLTLLEPSIQDDALIRLVA